MKRVMVLCCVVACACLVFASQSEKKGTEAPATPGFRATEIVTPEVTSDAADVMRRSEEKTLYYSLSDKVMSGTATEREMADVDRLGAVYGLPTTTQILDYIGFSSEGEIGRDGDGSLDQGSVDTLGNCASATVIPGCPYADTGFLDGDNDCSVISASPYNEVFYKFTPTATGVYIFRLRNYNAVATASAIRIVSGGCCAGAVAVTFSSSSIATDCQNIVNGGFEPTTSVVYCRATLGAGVPYWIHCGISSTTIITTAAYDLNMWCAPPCPTNEAALHATCTTAQAVACGDSIFGDSAIAASPDWYTFTVGGIGADITIRVTGRELLHCNSGYYGGLTPVIGTGPVDGRYTLWSSCSGLPADSIGFDDDGGTTAGSAPAVQVVTCSFDAARTFSLNPGTYYVKVWNYGVQEYIYSMSCAAFPDCANEFQPCGASDETEPNGACANIANAHNLDICDGTYDGQICPASDVDLWYIPPTTPPQIVTISITDGPACATFPPTSFAFALAGTPPACGTLGTTNFAGAFVGGCQAWPGGYIGVRRFAGTALGGYQLHVTCSEYTCPCELPGGVPGVGQVCTSCVGPILDNLGFDYSLNPVSTEYHITDLNVCVDITHTWRADVTLYLVTPWADTIQLDHRRGSSSDNWSAVVFDDEAANPISADPLTTPLTGSWRPEELLSAVDGYNAMGTWHILVNDSAGGDVGYINCVCLNFSYDAILATELADFDAVAGDGEITLNWATASETNNDHFEVMRNGAKLTDVAATNSATGSSYSWTDENLTNGTIYNYSLVSVDIMGGREEIGTVSATPNFGSATVTAYALHQNYPNPFNPTTNITFDVVEPGFVKLSVFNLLGQEVSKVVNSNVSAGRHTVSFDATGLSSGLYLYKMEVNGYSAQKKLLLLK